MKRIIFCMLIPVVLYSCSEDYDNMKCDKITDNSFVIGEWVAVNHSQNGFTDILFSKNKRVEMALIQDSVGRQSIYKEDVGSWDANDDIISFTVFNNDISQHQLVDVNIFFLQLRNLRYNTLDVYYRVVETVELDAGYEYPINYLVNNDDFIPVEIISGNSDVATVSKDGIITAHQGGITFISLRSNQRTAFVKVKVRSRIEVYSEETQLTFSEITKKRGEADIVSQEDGFSEFLYYGKVNDKVKGGLADSGVMFVSYKVDKNTDEIVRINTTYIDTIPQSSDNAFLKDYYFPIKNTQGFMLYGERKYRSENNVLLRLYSDEDGWPVISYHNMNYLYR